jgi:predicted transcriptional regulator
MREIYINPRIVASMGLSSKEMAVFDALLRQRGGKTTMKIARSAGVPRSTAVYVLAKLVKRGLAVKGKGLLGRKCPVWRYKNGLEFLHVKNFRES